MYESILIKNVDLVLSDKILHGDIFLKNGKIVEFNWSLNYPAELIINEPGLTVLPGIIDTHVHFRDPGFTEKEDFFTGSKAAVKGGVTTIFDMPNNNPPTITQTALEEKIKIASSKSLVNYQFFFGATKNNLAELRQVENIAGFKIFLGASFDELIVNDPIILEEIFANAKYPIVVHAELAKVSPNGKNITSHSLEEAINGVKIAIKLARKYQKRLHILHVTSKAELDIIKKNKRFNTLNGFYLTCEVTPQHLLLHNPEAKAKTQAFSKVNPPIREKIDQIALYTGLLDQTIDSIATDHAPHLKIEKNQVYNLAPSGMPGIETSLSLMLNEFNLQKISLNQISQLMSGNPAKNFKIFGRGEIKKEYYADLVIVDLKAKKKVENKNLVTKCGWSVFDGQTLTGWPIITIVNGQIVYWEGDFFTEIKGKMVDFDL